MPRQSVTVCTARGTRANGRFFGALEIDEKVYGPGHPSVAIRANNLGAIFKSKGDLDAALEYIQRALKIDEKVYGPDHPTAAIYAYNISQILKEKGDLNGALQYIQRALKIDEKTYGLRNAKTEADSASYEEIRQLMRK